MDSNPMIFDISSDEEPASFDGLRSGGGGGNNGDDDDDDHDWLTGLLETVDREREWGAGAEAEAEADSYSDEVVVVGEYIPEKKKTKLKSFDDGDDDDCVVLDGDPEKAVDVVDHGGGVDKDGDDVLVVGEKGEIACRDFPHSRHLCAKYPFSSTPHEKHCELCHCYVCDSPAPCVHWSTGVSTVDHCHATEKQDMWKSLRENFRLRKCCHIPVPKFPDAHIPVAVPQLNQVAALDVIQLVPNLGTHNNSNKISRPTTIRACSSARSSVPNIISQSRHRRVGYAQVRNGFLPRSVSQQPLGVSIRNKTTVQGRGQQYVSSSTIFKRPGIIRGAEAMNQSVYGSSNNINCAPASLYARNAVPQTAANAKNTTVWQGALPPNMISDPYTCPRPSQPNMTNVSINAIPSFSEAYNQPVPQPNDGADTFQYGNQSQNVVDSSSPDFDLSWLDILDQSNQPILAENIHHRMGHNNEPTSVKQLSSQLTESTEHRHKDHEYESWLLAESEAAASEGCVPADLNVFSPEPSAFDAGMLCFDFETSWNGLAQV